MINYSIVMRPAKANLFDFNPHGFYPAKNFLPQKSLLTKAHATQQDYTKITSLLRQCLMSLGASNTLKIAQSLQISEKILAISNFHRIFVAQRGMLRLALHLHQTININ